MQPSIKFVKSEELDPRAPGKNVRLDRAIRLAVAGIIFSGTACAQNAYIPGAPPGLVETGTPAFVVLPPSTLGLSSPPTDIDVMPDGRLLLVASGEITRGDGVRWETFHQDPGAEPAPLSEVVVDETGGIHTAIAGGFARLEFGDNAQWRLVTEATFADNPDISDRVLARVSNVHGAWYWTAGSGALVQWQPGRTAIVLGYANDVERVLSAGGDTLVGDGSTGDIFRVRNGTLEAMGSPGAREVSDALTASITLPDGRAIVGTNNAGAFRFTDGAMVPLANGGLLGSGHRINDLCATNGGYLCAALDNFGLVFFDPAGRVVQVLDRTVDHRLARVRRLVNLAGGTVCALLQEGLAQVQFPARVSFFEPLVTTGLTYALPTRHDGRLWLLADGQAQRGVYDTSGRLLRFDVDTPGPWVSTILSTPDRLMLATVEGVYERRGGGWLGVAPNILNAHLAPVRADPNRWLVVANDEVGWLRPSPQGLLAYERFPVPGLGRSYGTVLETSEAFWAELGTSRVARIVDHDGRLAVRILDRADGLPDGWVQAFLIDDVVRFNVAGRIYRYDATSDRIVPDREFLAFAPDLISEHGRPARDPAGRLWITTDEAVRVIDDRAGNPGTLERMPAAFHPIAFTIETSGAVWMHQRQRLVRFDPSLPEVEPAPLRAVIGEVQLVGSGRTLTPVDDRLPALSAADNSLVVHCFAPEATLGTPVTFDVRLEGASDAWVPTGTSGSASFAQLHEGHYVLHVRPRAGPQTGAEATVAFTIHPPWFRTPLAYGAYVAAAFALLLGIGLGWSYLARREKVRLARLVTERTAELRGSEEKVRRLNEELEQRVAQRTAELHDANERLRESNRELEAFSYSVSHDLRTPLRNIRGFADLLLRRASSQLDAEGNRYIGVVSAETTRLGHLIDSLLNFSRLNRAEMKQEAIDPAALVAAVRAELAADCAGRNVAWQIGPLPAIAGDATLLRQVFANLVGNAVKFTRGRDPAVITITGEPDPRRPGEIVFCVRDNGAGFNPRYTDKLFGVFQRLHGGKDFEGSGIGLAIVRRIVARHGGHTWAEGAPEGGATFYFSLPQQSKKPEFTAS